MRYEEQELSYSEIMEKEEPMKIKLTRGYEAIVDVADFEWLNQHKWKACVGPNTVYARRQVLVNGVWLVISMHRIILGITESNTKVDHIDLNGLNNKRSNLRPCTIAQNNCNKRSAKNSTSKYLGVHIKICSTKSGYYKYWEASIRPIGLSQRSLGLFKFTEEGEVAAALAYNEAAKKHHREFARLNIITE